MPQLSFTAKEIHILVQALRAAMEDGSIDAYARKGELEVLRAKLQNVKDT